MPLDRNLTPDGHGKYALVKLRGAQLPFERDTQGRLCIPEELIDFGSTPETEFFVMRLRDEFVPEALERYAYNASKAASQLLSGPAGVQLVGYASDVYDLSARSTALRAAGKSKIPD